jgi:hypothetical protein
MMRIRILGSTKNYLIIGILITTLGTVFFFPLNIDGRYTCLYHRIFDHSHPVSKEVNFENRYIHPQDFDQSENKSSTVDDRENSDNTENNMINTHHRSVLLENYLNQYAFAWWLSIGLLAFSIFMWLKLKKQYRKRKC